MSKNISPLRNRHKINGRIYKKLPYCGIAVRLGSYCIPQQLIELHQQKTADAEESLINSWFDNNDTLTVNTDSEKLYISRNDLKDDINSYQGQGILSRSILGKNLIGLELIGGGREGYQKYISSSKTVLSKIVNHFGLNIGSNDEKVKKILLFLQSKDGHMLYRYDSDPEVPGEGEKVGGREHLRKPGISIVNGILKNGYIGDCDDYASNFIALSQEAGIPSKDLFFIVGPSHVFAGISDENVIQDKNTYIILPNGKRIIPIEATSNAIMKITNQGFQSDTTYQRNPTIGGNINIELAGTTISVWGEEYPHGLQTTITQ